ncbi:MAG: hypothetical protein R3D03_11000 [Geminicoccaceae bacterium]
MRRYPPLFRSAEAPDPGQGGLVKPAAAAVLDIVGDRDPEGHAMCIRTDGAYGSTVSSSLALPADIGDPPAWLFADGPRPRGLRACRGPERMALPVFQVRTSSTSPRCSISMRAVQGDGTH